MTRETHYSSQEEFAQTLEEFRKGLLEGNRAYCKVMMLYLGYILETPRHQKTLKEVQDTKQNTRHS